MLRSMIGVLQTMEKKLKLYIEHPSNKDSIDADHLQDGHIYLLRAIEQLKAVWDARMDNHGDG